MIGDAPRPASPTMAVVRQASADDLDAVMGIMVAAFSPSFGEAWTRSQCVGILPMAGVALRLARDASGKANGFSLMRVISDEAELLLIAVDPRDQQRGVGRALLDDFVTVARAQGARRLHLEVRDGNPAIALYRKAGFTLAGRRRGYYHGPDGRALDALTLALGADQN
ncbi:MAG: GNAT family N-acetyltransferase [Pseudomonadota bacterium]|nr:GNAT family N-acetyltransferase [Pseudomonadota bacterium]